MSTALILGYQMVYYAPRMKKVEAQRRLEAAERARVDSLARATAKREAGPADEIAATPKTRSEIDTVRADTTAKALSPGVRARAARVVVVTPHYRMTLSTAGAEVISTRLLDYETAGEPVELIASSTDGSGALTVALVGETQRQPLDGLLFDAYLPGGTQPLADGTVVRLDPTSESRTIVFRSRAGPGVEGGAGQIERYYTVSADGFRLRTGIRYGARAYGFARRIAWGLGPGLTTTEENRALDFQAFKATLRLGDEYHKKKRGNFDEHYSGVVHWAALQTKYFAAVLLPPAPTGGEARMSGVKDETAMTASIELPTVERGGRVDQAIDVYFGPLDFKKLQSMNRGLEKIVQLGFDHVKIFQPLSRGVLWSMQALYKVIPNYGVVILLISIFTKVVFYRLTHKSFKSMRDMQALQPKLQALKEKYKDDRQKLSQETMRLYKDGGVNPLGGCLPMLFQMPVFLALFNVLRNVIELRRAPFFGWINDLSQQDVLFKMPFALPVVGDAVSVLPILMGVGMLMQSKIGGSIAGPGATTSQPKAFTYMMPIVFTFLFYKMPSGLVLYWLVNTVLSVAQQYYVNKGADDEDKVNGVISTAEGNRPVKARRIKAKKGQ